MISPLYTLLLVYLITTGTQQQGEETDKVKKHSRYSKMIKKMKKNCSVTIPCTVLVYLCSSSFFIMLVYKHQRIRDVVWSDK